MQSPQELLFIATVGRSVGLRGENRLVLETDFPAQFVKGAVFTTQKNGTLEVESYRHGAGTIKFVGIDTPEAAKKITNTQLFTTVEASKAHLKLKKNEHFWFDVIGCEVYEGDVLLGSVEEIERIAITDYLIVATHPDLVAKALPKSFLIPYIDHYIRSCDTQTKRIDVVGGMDLLEAS
ncbi:MAG: hypothetical protein KU28_00775 [Sulfurovum sp. PC08-66]|nr:MAG: hypothetical protein KU28_00775 [Sulfurovum sp. PC08-66]KIM12500.1 MAG: hypothetical protein KU37_00890 [Sulfuricurvum sp. PC08-66]